MGPKQAIGVIPVSALLNTKSESHDGLWCREEHDVVVRLPNQPLENLGSSSGCGKFT